MFQNRGSGFGGVPVVVKNIIIINVIMVLAQFALINVNINLDDYLALHYWKSPQFHWWQFITHMFMHGSPDSINNTFMHIFFNMYGLYMFGSIFEERWGAKRFLIYYMVCGVGAALFHMGIHDFELSSLQKEVFRVMQSPSYEGYNAYIRTHKYDQMVPAVDKVLQFWKTNPSCSDCAEALNGFFKSLLREMSDTSMVGASGAIFGLLFAFGYMYPNVEMMIMFIPIPIKAKWLIAGYAAMELFSGFGRFAGDNVAHFAHLGGMLFGFILLKAWGSKSSNRFY